MTIVSGIRDIPSNDSINLAQKKAAIKPTNPAYLSAASVESLNSTPIYGPPFIQTLNLGKAITPQEERPLFSVSRDGRDIQFFRTHAVVEGTRLPVKIRDAKGLTNVADTQAFSMFLAQYSEQEKGVQALQSKLKGIRISIVEKEKATESYVELGTLGLGGGGGASKNSGINYQDLLELRMYSNETPQMWNEEKNNAKSLKIHLDLELLNASEYKETASEANESIAALGVFLSQSPSIEAVKTALQLAVFSARRYPLTIEGEVINTFGGESSFQGGWDRVQEMSVPLYVAKTTYNLVLTEQSMRDPNIVHRFLQPTSSETSFEPKNDIDAQIKKIANMIRSLDSTTAPVDLDDTFNSHLKKIHLLAVHLEQQGSYVELPMLLYSSKTKENPYGRNTAADILLIVEPRQEAILNCVLDRNVLGPSTISDVAARLTRNGCFDSKSARSHDALYTKVISNSRYDGVEGLFTFIGGVASLHQVGIDCFVPAYIFDSGVAAPVDSQNKQLRFYAESRYPEFVPLAKQFILNERKEQTQRLYAALYVWCKAGSLPKVTKLPNGETTSVSPIASILTMFTFQRGQLTVYGTADAVLKKSSLSTKKPMFGEKTYHLSLDGLLKLEYQLHEKEYAFIENRKEEANAIFAQPSLNQVVSYASGINYSEIERQRAELMKPDITFAADNQLVEVSFMRATERKQLKGQAIPLPFEYGNT